MSVHERIAEARRELVRAGLTPEEARLDAEVLARHALGWDRARLIADGREPMPRSAQERYASAVARRAAREPVAFITGSREFWGLEFEVSPDVLIPRPETELIVEAVRARRDKGAADTIADVGTGSGCLAVSLARELPGASIVAIDLSEAALDVARRNAARHAVGDRIAFLRSDLLDSLGAPVDVIVSNPPYVPSAVQLSPEIVRFEPELALYAGPDGLSIIRRLIASARRSLAPSGLFVMEFGLGQDEDVRALAEVAGWSSVSTVNDLQGIPRIAIME
jgi:release factor glutamine methyltransferase